ncbi:Gmad2 immunoglobulin-like domain-containing protein [Nocardioides sp. GXQ0305]|uniref:Gmad2 immunoglobulin-like domain-containing protein n=1 Tax=Nocardioides sp. GXQ0305 TaxID=3423912 RepID=UPI003D7D2D37
MSPRDQLDPELDRRLGELLRGAVSGIEPDDRLGELRARVSRPPRRRAALVALAGAALAGGAAVAAVAVGPELLGDDDPVDPPVASSPGAASDDADAESSAPPVAARAVAGYYLGETPAGVRLYREFRSVESADDGPDASVRLLTTAPADPDYRTEWPDGAFAGAEVGDDRITVELADPSLEDLPESMTEEEARASVQQVVYTLQAYAQQRLPVEFTTTDGPVDQVLGTASVEPQTAATPIDILSHVNLSAPDEGQAVSGRMSVEGVASSFEGNVPWTLTDEAGQTVDQGFFTAKGSMGVQLHPFRGRIDLSSVEPGTYTLEVTTDDPTGGAEGPGAFSDTRRIVVE